MPREHLADNSSDMSDRISKKKRTVLVPDTSSSLLYSYTDGIKTERDHIKFSGRLGLVFAQNNNVFLGVDEDIVRLSPLTLNPIESHVAGSDVERILMSSDEKLLYILLSGADTLLMMDAATGEWISSEKVGSNPRGMRMDKDGKRIAVAGGDSNSVFVLDSKTLEIEIEYPLSGTAVDCMFSGDSLLMISESGDWDNEPLSQISAAHENTGDFENLFLLRGMPTCFTLAMNGLLVGHMNGITMVNLQYREIEWRININGLPDLIQPMGRHACYMDRLIGRIGMIDCFEPTLIESKCVREPAGLAIVNM